MMEETSNVCKNGHRRKYGQKNPVTKETKGDRTTTMKDIKAIVACADSVEHRIGPIDSIYAPQNL